MDTNIVPVTEAEMRGIADRLISTVVGYSSQARELEQLKAQMTTLSDQVRAMTADNYTLRRERDEALQMAVENEAKMNDARKHRDELISKVGTLSETIFSRDARVKELEGLEISARLALEDEQRAHTNTRRQRDDFEHTLNTVRERRDHWQNRAEDAERELAETKAKLKAIEDQVTSVFGLVRPQAQEVPAQSDPQTGAGSGSGQSITTEPKPIEAPKPWWEASPKSDAAF